jgi:hypothetical protein
MSIFNISLNQDFAEIFKTHIFQTESQLSPNFSKILALVPSKQIAQKLKLKFASEGVIMPKIIALAEINDNFLFSAGIEEDFFEFDEISDLQNKILLYGVAKEFLQGFSVHSCFEYIEDFLELETMIALSEVDLAENLMKLENTIINFSESLQHSLLTFLKIFAKWQAFKQNNKKITRLAKNILSLKSFIQNIATLPYSKIFTLGANGTNKLQIELVKTVANLPNGNIIFSGLELEEGKEMGAESVLSFLKILKIEKSDVIFLPNIATKEAKYNLMEFDNIAIKSRQIAGNIKFLLSENPARKIGIICYNQKTGVILGDMLSKLELEFSTVFTESMAENEVFRLLELLLKSFAKLDCYLSLIKNPLTNFPKEEVKIFEKALRKPNLGVMRPFEVPKFAKNLSFFEFLENAKNILIQVQKPEILLTESWISFIEFLENIKLEIEDFTLPENSDYISILTNFAGTLRFKLQTDSQIEILSPVEARGEKFDILFMADISSNIVPKSSGKNKILNSYLQELLLLKADSTPLEWLDFTEFLHAADEIFLCFAKTAFEEKKMLEYSPFLRHAILHYAPKSCEKYFFSEQKPVFANPNPAFNLDIMPSKITPTSLKNLINNPYIFYISHVLNLKNPNEISTDMERRHIGEIIHDAIYKFFKYGFLIDKTCQKELFERGYPYNYFLYESSFLEISNFFLNEREILAKNPPLKIMMEEEISFDMPIFFESLQAEKTFKMVARPDKIEFYTKEIRIIDYKVYSEKIPFSAIAEGREPQLLLQALILQEIMPDFQGQIRLFYYYINIMSPDKILEKVEIPMQNLRNMKNDIAKLITSLPSFFYNEGDKNSFYQHLVRFYDEKSN